MDTRPQHSALDTRDNLQAIADTWTALHNQLPAGGKGHTNGPRPAPGSRVPISAHVSDTIATITQWTNFLARTLTDETDWTPPNPLTVPATLENIAATRLGHFTAHPDEHLALAFHDDARENRRLAEAAAYPRGQRLMRLGISCQHGTEDSPCTGQYTILMDPDKPGLIPDMICNHNRTHTITPDAWQRARRRTNMNPTAAARLATHIVQGS